MITKKQLEIILSKLKMPERPKENLEQYTIPSGLAADILNLAMLSGDVKNKTVFDFGCGAGHLAIGAALLGAKKVIGVDIDKCTIEIAKENARNVGVNVKFICEDVKSFSGMCDTVVQNPPFGMRGEKHMDRVFLEKALECGKKIYSLHRGGYEHEKTTDKKRNKTREFLARFIEKSGGRVLAVKEYKFNIPYMFKFHKKPKVSYNVDLFVIEKVRD